MKEQDLKAINFNTKDRNLGGGLVAQFAGAWTGLNVDQIRAFIRNQKKAQGYSFAAAPGVNNPFPLQVSGDARILLGISLIAIDPNLFDPSVYPDQVTFQVNNEIIIKEMNGYMLNRVWMDEDYFPVPRPLSGQDDVSVIFRNGSAVVQNLSLTLHYI